MDKFLTWYRMHDMEYMFGNSLIFSVDFRDWMRDWNIREKRTRRRHQHQQEVINMKGMVFLPSSQSVWLSFLKKDDVKREECVHNVFYRKKKMRNWNVVMSLWYYMPYSLPSLWVCIIIISSSFCSRRFLEWGIQDRILKTKGSLERQPFLLRCVYSSCVYVMLSFRSISLSVYLFFLFSLVPESLVCSLVAVSQRLLRGCFFFFFLKVASSLSSSSSSFGAKRRRKNK